MRLKFLKVLIFFFLYSAVDLRAQDATREVVDGECLLVAVRGKGRPQIHENSVGILDLPNFFPMGVPRLDNIAASLSSKNRYDSQGYLTNSKFYIFAAKPEDLKDFYAQEALDERADSIDVVTMNGNVKNFSDSLRKISKNVFFLKEEDLAMEFVVVRARWVKYIVRNKPKMLFPVLRR